MSEEVKFIRGNDRINQLAQRPDIGAEAHGTAPHDLLLSTLNAYLQAIGGTARMIVSFARMPRYAPAAPGIHSAAPMPTDGMGHMPLTRSYALRGGVPGRRRPRVHGYGD